MSRAAYHLFCTLHVFCVGALITVLYCTWTKKSSTNFIVESDCEIFSTFRSEWADKHEWGTLTEENALQLRNCQLIIVRIVKEICCFLRVVVSAIVIEIELIGTWGFTNKLWKPNLHLRWRVEDNVILASGSHTFRIAFLAHTRGIDSRTLSTSCQVCIFFNQLAYADVRSRNACRVCFD
jgi:hypothetical protein